MIPPDDAESPNALDDDDDDDPVDPVDPSPSTLDTNAFLVRLVLVPNASASRACSPELALVRLATEACESVAAVLETRLVSLPEEDRAAFAAALKRSSERVFKCR